MGSVGMSASLTVLVSCFQHLDTALSRCSVRFFAKYQRSATCATLGSASLIAAANSLSPIPGHDVDGWVLFEPACDRLL
jgi:hypothetical protein